ncbi:energy transducer TonB [Nostoc edaphicum CCNP1411]|uniref:Energy transducer TonB n=1 Tax=Nostoc edaphicum CCNP1411 TaxID=1472755 RepID=A0A7D7LBS6_9NOSO|nr:energy transducer TonB [Nostoc edaphicum]QMS88228.1 energy transducer TonB [Nostoc edaphicum CCNP1411]
MSFSGITVEQRSKEVEALKSFLTYSLIGSLALHIGVLSSGIGNYLTRVPTEEDDAIEFAIVDSPTAEPEKPLEKIPEEPKKEPEIIQKQSIETPQVQKPVQEFIERPKIQPVQEQPKQTTQNPQPTNREIAPKTEAPVTAVAPSTNQSSQQLRGVLSGLRDSRASQNPSGGGGGSGVLTGSGSGVALGTGSGSGSGSGSGTGSGIGSGSGSGTGSGSGSGNGTGNEPVNRLPVATAPTLPKVNTSGNGNGNGRAACRECNAKYPEAARRRGVEGRVEVAVDTDAQGNVTNVRIARSSGNRDLDEETARQARNWKLKPAEGGRQGVSIATEFAIKGSRRSRQVQERQAQRQAQRQAEERTQETRAANSTEENPRRRRRELSPPSKPAISGFSRRLQPQRVENTPTSPSSGARTTRTQGTARESLRRIQRERATTNSSQKPQPTTNRRRRRDTASQNKLRESLRGLRQKPQSQPAAPSQE